MTKSKYSNHSKRKLIDIITGLKVRIYALITKNRDYKAQLMIIKNKLKNMEKSIGIDTRNKSNW